MLIGMGTGLAVSSAVWGQELAQAEAEFAKQDKTLNAGYGKLRKTCRPRSSRGWSMIRAAGWGSGITLRSGRRGPS
jgi:hypothetical protein